MTCRIDHLSSASRVLVCALAAIASLIPTVALAHAPGGTIGGLESGFQHPLLGLDHLLAMFAVGLWGAQIGGRSVWSLAVTFPLIMAVGGVLGVQGVPLGPVEIGIAASVLVLGLAILLRWRAPELVGLAIVGAFALFHGHAHGAELPAAANPAAYGIGFVIATGLIHLAGIGFGLVIGQLANGWVSRAAGGAIAGVGAVLLAT